jgi:drug/metabolite transporter (DMT)-like permease
VLSLRKENKMTWIIYSLTAMALVATAMILEKKSLLREHAMQFSAVLAIVNMIIALPFLITANYSTLNLQIVTLMFFASILGSLAFLFMAKSVRHTEISIAAPLLALSPALTALIGFIILGEKIGIYQILGILLIVAGSYVITLRKEETFIQGIIKVFKYKYYRFIIFAIILYSFASVVDKFFLTTYNLDATTYVAIMQIFIALHLFMMISVFHNGINDIKEGFKQAKWLILLIAVCTVGYRVAQSEAFKLAETGIVIAVKRASALIVVLVGGEMFQEKHLIKKTIAALIIVAGILLIIL